MKQIPVFLASDTSTLTDHLIFYTLRVLIGATEVLFTCELVVLIGTIAPIKSDVCITERLPTDITALAMITVINQNPNGHLGSFFKCSLCSLCEHTSMSDAPYPFIYLLCALHLLQGHMGSPEPTATVTV